MKSHIKKKMGRRVICSLVILSLICGILLPSITANAGKTKNADKTENANRIKSTNAKEKTTTVQKVVKVAFPEQEGMSFIGRFGKVTGYNYDYLSKVSEYTGWKLDYTFYRGKDTSENVVNAMMDVKDGKADLIGPILKNEQTEKMFEFPENSYGTVYTTLCALNSSGIRENNIKNKKLLKVGLWKQAETRNEEVINYLKTEKFSYKLFYYDSSEEQLQALQEGKIDVISSVSLSPISNTKIVEKFAARPYYFVSTKGNKEVVKELDDTIKKIDTIQPKLQDSLFEKYFNNTEDIFSMTEEQKTVLSAMGKIRVLCVDNDAPFVYQEKGEPKGALVLLLNDFAKAVDLKIDYTFCDSRDEAEKLLEEKTYDVLIGAPFSSDYCAKKGFIKSESIFESALAFVQNTSNSKRNSIAVVKGLESLINTANYSNVIICDNAKECIDAVNSKKVDVAAGDRSIMEYYIYDTDSSLTTSLITGGTQNIRVAVSRECSLDFLTVLNNYIYSLPDLNKTLYLSDGNKHSNSATFTHYVRTHPVEATLIVIALTAIIAIAIFMLWYAKQMNKKNEQLRIANEVKAEFLAKMSHDIRTPINGILGMLNIADKYADNPEEVRNYHKKIHIASGYLLSLVNNVLDMNKLEAKDIDMKADSLYLHEVTDSCVEIMRSQAEERGIELISEELHNFYPPRVFSNEQCLRRIFINIIENAIKYNKENGTIRVAGEVTEQTEESITCRFCVQDTGIGMSEEFQGRMFEAFEQENHDARSEYKGTGLGLSIVKQMIEQMGGEISVKSKREEGTTVEWTLTFTMDKEYKETEEQKRKIATKQINLQGLKILAAEDNHLNAEILHFMLEEAGAEVILVENGKLAVEEFERSEVGTYDYILTDIMMPVMDGYAVVKTIRSMERPDAKTIPIIALTANAFVKSEEKALEMGMDAYIIKPFTIDKLKECMADLKGED